MNKCRGGSVINSFASFFMSIILLIIGIITPSVPDTKNTDELAQISVNFSKYDLPDNIYVIDNSVLDTTDKAHLMISLQGIVAKTLPSIYIKTVSTDDYYLAEIEKSGIALVYTDENGDRWTVESLLDKFKSYIGDSGYVLYRESESGEGLNMATNLSTIYGYLAVPESLEQLAVDAGLQLKEDFSDDDYNVYFQLKFFNKYKKEFNYNAVVHENYNMKALRDFAIQQGFFTFYLDDDADGTWFRDYVLKYAGDNCLVLGWAKDEVRYVAGASENGNPVIPSDHCYNNSFITSFECDLPEQAHKETKTYTDETKHYCALLFSDGDNVQWIQNGFSEYYQKLSLETDFPMTWTFPPILQDMSPLTYSRIIGDSTVNDYFIAGVSGAGYIHPSEYPYKALAEFTDITASLMLKSNLEYVSFLDNLPENALKEARLIESFKYYARYDNIKGGVIYLDPDRYAGGKGRVYFVNDKPFVSARLSLWHQSNQMNEVTREWIDEQAEIVNSYDADIHSINGYSVINVHPWSMSIENLEYFVNQLDDDIVLVTVDELLEMIKANVPHENAEVNENV